MAKHTAAGVDHPHVRAILEQTGESDPRAAIRAKARAHIDLLRTLFPDAAPPFNMEVLASLRDIKESEDPPAFSKDSELVPDETGGVLMRVNRARPRSRQRFSIGHEIGHTFFPGYEEKVQCRKDKERDWADPDDVIESLCDVAASEFLFPLPWFEQDCARHGVNAGALLQLASGYQASLDATVRRYAEISTDPVAAVFFTWKLKPKQQREVGREDQPNLFGVDPAEEADALRKLRVEYSIRSPAFDGEYHIPADKSADTTGCICAAAVSRCCRDADEHLDLGSSCRGRFKITAIPLFTKEEDLGPNGETAVVAVIQPLDRRPKLAQELRPLF